MEKFNVILASSKNDVIGKNNSLPWKIKEDMQYFSKITTTSPTTHPNIVIMGRKTWESIPEINGKKLKDRMPIIISTTMKKDNYDYLVVNTFNEALMEAYNLPHNKIWVIGGLSIYNIAFNHYLCGTIYHTLINDDYEGDIKLKLPDYNIIKKDFCENNEKVIFRQLELVGEISYLRLLSKIIFKGDYRKTRNSKTLSLFDEKLVFDMKNGFPLLTTKKMFWKGIVEELLFFIRGDTNSKHLEEKGVNIWKGNTNQEFIDKLGLPYKEGDMGPMYGFNWRHFGAEYHDCDYNYKGKGFDQLTKVIEEIKTNPHSRRIIMSDFNPAQANKGVLYPCHSLVLQFYIRENNILDVIMYQRSVDSFLGLPFNIASTSLLLHIISKLTNKKPGKVTINMGDVHIYEKHIEQVTRQLKRLPYRLPTLKILNFDNIEQVENSNLEDYIIKNYNHHKGIKAEMVA